MKKAWGIFWGLYMLFFAVPFPMIIYYATEGPGQKPPRAQPVWDYIFLSVSIACWLLILTSLFRYLVLSDFRMRSSMIKLLHEGKYLEGTITKSLLLKKHASGYEQRMLHVQLENLAGTLITDTISITDSRPQEARYVQGNTLRLRIDETLRSKPVMVPDGIQVKLNYVIVPIKVLLFFLVTGAVAYYYYYCYTNEGQSNHWGFLQLMHPLLFAPGFILLTFFLVRGVFSRLLAGNRGKALRIKYKGVKTTAYLRKVSQTEVYINNHPQVKMELEFTDQQGQLRQAEVKRVVQLIELENINKKEVPVMYLEEDPEEIMLTEDIES